MNQPPHQSTALRCHRFTSVACRAIAHKFLQCIVLCTSFCLLPSFAATIVVDRVACNIIPAFQAASTNSSVTGCTSGSSTEVDTIILPVNDVFTFTSDFYAKDPHFSGNTLFEEVIGELIVEGNGSQIIRSNPTVGSRPIFRYFYVNDNATLTLNNLTLDSGLLLDAIGGSIYNAGKLVLNQSTIIRSDAFLLGAAIYADSGSEYTHLNGSHIALSGTGASALTFAGGSNAISYSLLSLNHSSGDGGALSAFGAGTETRIARSTFLLNSASDDGGAISNSALMDIADSTFDRNTAADLGGALYTSGSETDMWNNTLSANSATNAGGAIYQNTGVLVMNNNLVSGNTMPASSGGKEIHAVSANFHHSHNLFGHNGITTAQAVHGFSPAATDIITTSDGAQPTALGQIILPRASVSGAGVADTIYFPLANNSPAIDAGVISVGYPGITNTSGCAFVVVYRNDQLNVPRPQGSACDIGAIEKQQSNFYVIPLTGGRAVVVPL